MLYALAVEPLLVKIRESIEGWSIPYSNERIKLSAYADDIIVLIKDQNNIMGLKNSIDIFGLISSAKVNWSKSEALLCGKWFGGPPKLPGGLSWKSDGIKYLGVYLGNNYMLQRNWEGVLKKVKGKFEKWKWLLPKMSFRGRVIVINNLVTSMLWHRLICVDPPNGLLAKLQAIIVDFFWNGYHWIAQSILFLPREKGGQGLHLASRRAVFRLLFIQRYLTGPEVLVLRKVANIIFKWVSGLDLNSVLFLMDSSKLQINASIQFYKGLFNIWQLFKKPRQDTSSLYWLLKEPLVHGARLDVACEVTPGLSQILCSSKALRLHNLMDIGGPELSNVQAVASFLRVQSVRQFGKIIDLLMQRLTVEEKTQLKEYYNGKIVPVNSDPFPNIFITPDLKCLNIYIYFFWTWKVWRI